jgi:hypothetical protein
MVQRTAAMLTAAAGEALKTLVALQKESMPPATRLGAARAVVVLYWRWKQSWPIFGSARWCRSTSRTRSSSSG